ncbi:hypothetical protein FDG2_0003 [Candidatus Protofrankia californiensis]|uniref:Uncharacterized protein n=1 Tax=Candidatus Protofrankia californiensis TaxID=1839754 RepID=A0A1C3NSP4_9ACTN|nr:hypothetical protein FDG2_0003 [Candidatus Protofrankia californiensis]
METTTRKKDIVYLRCRIRASDGHDAGQRWPGHPTDLYLPQRVLLEGILDFFADRVYGQDRRHLFDREIAEADKDARLQRQEKIIAIERSLDDLNQRRRRLLTILETTDDLDEALRQDINRRSAEITDEQETKRRDVADLRAHPPTQTGSDTELFDLLGTISRAELDHIPEELLRDLFDAYGLEITYDARVNLVTCTVRVDENSLPIIAGVTGAVQHIPSRATELGMVGVRSARHVEHPQPPWPLSLRIASTFALDVSGG